MTSFHVLTYRSTFCLKKRMPFNGCILLPCTDKLQSFFFFSDYSTVSMYSLCNGNVIKCFLKKKTEKKKEEERKEGRWKVDNFVCSLSLSYGFGVSPTREISLLLESCLSLMRFGRKTHLLHD